jgi:hypothetical protein
MLTTRCGGGGRGVLTCNSVVIGVGYIYIYKRVGLKAIGPKG